MPEAIAETRSPGRLPSAPRHGISGCGKEGTLRPNKSRNINGNETKVRRQGSDYIVVAELGGVVRERRKKESEQEREGAAWWGTPLLRRTAIVASLVEQLRLNFPSLMAINY